MATAPNPLTDLSAVVTDVGLAVASLATPTGPWINIRRFKIGDGYGYKADRTDTGLNGNVLYEAPVTAYRNIPPKTINVMCSIPPIEGPFLFGELGLYIPSNTAPSDPTQDVLFAKLVFPSLQLKTSSLVTNVASSYTFNCLIDLEQSTAIFQINNGDLPAIWVVNKWSEVFPQTTMANPTIDMIIVQEPDPYGRSTALVPAAPDAGGLGTLWSPQGTYQHMVSTTIAAAATTSVTVSAASVADWNVFGRPLRTFVVQMLVNGLGYSRAIASVDSVAGGLVRFNFTPDPMNSLPAVGSPVSIYRENSNQDFLLNATSHGVGHPGVGLSVPRPGVFEARGLLHGAPGTGRVLTAAETLRDTTLPSGVYHTYQASHVQDAPTTHGGIIYISNVGGLITQQFWPQRLEDSNDPTRMPWWRFFDISVWGPWTPLGSSGIEGGQLISIGSFAPGQQASGTFERAGAIMAWNSGGDPAINGYLNGNMVTAGDSNGGSEGLTIVGYQGSNWMCVATRRTMYVWKMLFGN